MAAVGIEGHVLPFEEHDVRDSEAGEDGEEGCALEYFVFAGGVVQGADFVDGEVVLVGLFEADAFQAVVEVLKEKFLLVGDVEEGAEGSPVGGSGVDAEMELRVAELAGGEKELAVLVAEIDIDFLEDALAAAEYLEVFVAGLPFVGTAFQLAAEVFEEVHPEFALVCKSELFLHDGKFTFGSYGFGLFQLFVIATTLQGCPRILHKVDAQVLAPAHFTGTRVADCRVEVKIECDLSARELAFAELDFGSFHIFLSLLVGEYPVNGFLLEVFHPAVDHGGDVLLLGRVVDLLERTSVFGHHFPGGVIILGDGVCHAGDAVPVEFGDVDVVADLPAWYLVVGDAVVDLLLFEAGARTDFVNGVPVVDSVDLFFAYDGFEFFEFVVGNSFYGFGFEIVRVDIEVERGVADAVFLGHFAQGDQAAADLADFRDGSVEPGDCAGGVREVFDADADGARCEVQDFDVACVDALVDSGTADPKEFGGLGDGDVFAGEKVGAPALIDGIFLFLLPLCPGDPGAVVVAAFLAAILRAPQSRIECASASLAYTRICNSHRFSSVLCGFSVQIWGLAEAGFL